MTEFFIPMKPPTTTAQEHRVTITEGKTYFYDPPAVKDAKQKLAAHLSKHVPDKPYTSAVRLLTKWCFPLKGKHRDGDWRTSKPDTDNLQKLLKDVMTRLGFWRDDAQVCSEVAEKCWASTPGIFIRIEELEENGYSASEI